MSSGRGLHRIGGAIARRRADALAGPCAMCARKERTTPSVGIIESVERGPVGVCEVHAEQGRSLGYRVWDE